MTPLDYAPLEQKAPSIVKRLALVSLAGSVCVTTLGFGVDALEARCPWAKWEYSRWMLPVMLLAFLVACVRTFADQPLWARCALTIAALICAWIGTAVMTVGMMILFGVTR